MNNTIDAQNNVGKQTDDARSYLGNKFHLYKGYINSTLAGDFAFNLAKEMQKADAEIELKRSQLLNMDKLVMSIQYDRDKLLNELQDILSFSRVENSKLREQELESIEKLIQEIKGS